MSMSSRERVLTAVNLQEPDRIPLDLGGARVTTIDPLVLTGLKEKLGVGRDPVRVMDVWQMMSWVDREVVDILGVDVLPVPRLVMEFGMRLDGWVSWHLENGTLVQMPATFEPVQQDDGSLLLYLNDMPVAMKVPSSPYFDNLIEMSMRFTPPPVDSIPLESFSDEELEWRRQWAETLRAETDKALMGDFGMNLGRWGSYQEWLYHIAANPDWTRSWYDRKCELLMNNIKLYAQAVGENIDLIYLMEDFGTQDSMLISPQMFEKMVAPYYNRFFDWIHENTSWKIFFHTDGAVYPIIDKLIEIGIDILNPPQTNAKGMNPKRLKTEFGDRLAFWGAGIETQDVLPFGTKEEIRAQVKERIQIFGPGGGYVFSTIHNIQRDVPIENVQAMFEAFQQFAHYPIDPE
jgi:uroporphyrinogen decarboxylase